MASDLISREALFDAMREEEWQSWHPLDEVDAVIAKAPAVDAVPVVRCKDCIYRYRGSRAKCTGRRPDEFCSDGERRFKDAVD